MTVSLRLQPYARLLRRGSATVQVGLVGSGIVLSGLRDADAAFLERLAAGTDLETATRLSGPTARVGSIVAALEASDLLTEDAAEDPRPALHPERARLLGHEARARAACGAGDGRALVAARAARHVVVHGEGRLAQDLAAVLRDAGIGRLTCGGEVGLHDLAWREGEARSPDAVVLVGSGAVGFETAEPWRRRGVPHVPVVVDGHRLVVGPWVCAAGPCLTCLDLHRADRDPAWPLVLRQLTGSPEERVDADACLRAAAAAHVTSLVLTAVDGGNDIEAGITTEVSLPRLDTVRRRWSAHPRCRCAAGRGTIAE